MVNGINAYFYQWAVDSCHFDSILGVCLRTQINSEYGLIPHHCQRSWRKHLSLKQAKKEDLS